MPRRPPARLRAEQPRRPRDPWRRRCPIPHVNGASGALQAAVVRLENADTSFEVGGIAKALDGWRRQVRGQRRHLLYGAHDCGCCRDVHREILESALHRLPKRPARELRRLIEPLDERYRQRTIPVPQRTWGPWWWFRE